MAAQLIGRALRPAVQRWRAFWNVDHRAANFMTDDEYAAFKSSMAARYAAAEKEAAFSVTRRVLLRQLPRADGDAAPSGAAPRDAGADAAADETMLHLLWSSACAAPVLLYLALCLWSDTVVSEKELSDMRLSNRMILDKRVEAIEEALAADALAAHAAAAASERRLCAEALTSVQGGSPHGLLSPPPEPAAGGAAAQLARVPATAAGAAWNGDAAVYHHFMSGVQDELQRRKEAMRKPAPSAAQLAETERLDQHSPRPRHAAPVDAASEAALDAREALPPDPALRALARAVEQIDRRLEALEARAALSSELPSRSQESLH